MDPTLRQLMRYRKPQNVRQLFLDNQRIPSIELLCYEPCSSSSDTTDAYSPLPRFSGLLSLSLTGVHCTSLKNFPSLPELRRLALADNRIVDGLEALVDKVPLLNYLDLSNNRISDFLTLTPLRYMTKLRHLCLLDCEITKLPNYRAKIFEMLPTLQSLDGQDCNGQEVDSEEDDEEEDEDFESESYEGDTGEDTDEDGEEDEEEGQNSRVSIEAVLSRIQDGVYVNSDGEEIEVDQEALHRLIAKQRAAGVLLDDDEEDDEEDGDYATNSDNENEDSQISMINTLSDNEKESDEESSQVTSTNQSLMQEEEEELSLEEDNEEDDEEDEEDEDEEEEEEEDDEDDEGPGLAYLLQSPLNSDNDDDEEEEDSGWSPTKRKHETTDELFGDETESNSITKLESTDERGTDHIHENGTLKTKKPRR